MKVRFGYLDRNGDKCSTTGWVIWGFNHLNQRHQFATDGVRFFYQPDTRSSFIEVSEDGLPQSIREELNEARKTN